MGDPVEDFDERVEDRPAAKNTINSQDDLLKSEAAQKLLKGFCLSITYSASIGGTGSLVGSAPNLLLKGFYDEHYPEGGLNFLTYMVLAFPISVIMIFLTWIWMIFLWLPRKYLWEIFCKKDRNENHSQGDELTCLMKEKYERLGPFK